MAVRNRGGTFAQRSAETTHSVGPAPNPKMKPEIAVETAPLPKAGRASQRVTAAMVTAWWHTAAKGHGMLPDDRECRRLSVLTELAQIGEDHPNRQVRAQPVAGAIKLLQAKIAPARGHWTRRQIEAGSRDLTPGAALAKLDALSAALDGLPTDWLLEVTVTEAEPGWHVRARSLYPHAGRAWLAAGNTWGVPCATDPVCRFVRLALAGIRLETKPTAVWQFLRDCRWLDGEMAGRAGAR